jgi:integrase
MTALYPESEHLRRVPSEAKVVPRRRFQRGCVRIVGDKWVAYFYRDEIRDGIRKRVKVSKRIGHISLSRRQAEKLAQPFIDEANHQVEIPVRRMRNGLTLAEYIPEFRRVGMINLKPSTKKALESSISAHLIPVLGSLQLTKVDTAAVQELLNTMMGLARGTRENIVDDLSMILGEARKGHEVPVIKKQDLKFGLKKPGEWKAFCYRPHQVKAILKAVEGRPIWDCFFTVLAYSGLRASEILGLRVEDIDFEQNLIHVRQGIWHAQVITVKTEESENSVPMTSLMRAKLEAHLKNHPNELVFVNSRKRPFSRDKIVKLVLHPILDKLKINRKSKRVGLHAFRHCLASMLLQSRGVLVAQRQLRHSDPATTTGIYGHILGDDQREALAAVELVFSDK